MVRQIIFASVVVLLPVGAQAQGRGMMPPVAHVGGVAPRVMAQAPHVGITHAVPMARTVIRSGAVRPKTGMPVVRSTRRVGTTRSRFEDEDIGRRRDCNSAPGFGFDAVHQAAVCGSNLVGSRRFGQVPFFFPIFDGGFFLPGTSAGVEESSAADASQPEGADAENRDRDRRYRAPLQGATPTPAVETAKEAPPENDEFVFVRRDGTVFFAVGYSWENGTLSYITSQGLRHTVAQDALDLAATQQFNEQRGLIFRSPA